MITMDLDHALYGLEHDPQQLEVLTVSQENDLYERNS
jgi:hypothetical protein